LYDIIFIQEDHLSNKEFQQLKDKLNKKKKNLEKHIKKTGGFKLSSEKHSLGYKADTKNHRFIITPIRSSKQQRRKRNLFQRPQRTTR